jgi:hypothetical protein
MVNKRFMRVTTILVGVLDRDTIARPQDNIFCSILIDIAEVVTIIDSIKQGL